MVPLLLLLPCFLLLLNITLKTLLLLFQLAPELIGLFLCLFIRLLIGLSHSFLYQLFLLDLRLLIQFFLIDLYFLSQLLFFDPLFSLLRMTFHLHQRISLFRFNN